MKNHKVILAKHETFETERLLLRKISINDAQEMFDYAKRPEVAERAGFNLPEKLEDTENSIVTYFEDNRLTAWGMVDKESGKFIGTIGLKISDDKAEFGWSMNPDFWGRGLAVEAAGVLRNFLFDELEIAVIVASHFVGNSQSGRVMQKLGLRKIGQIYVTLQGSSQLSDYYALTKAEYLEKADKHD